VASISYILAVPGRAVVMQRKRNLQSKYYKPFLCILRYCCEAKVQPCDLAFMLSDRCYLVKCYSEDRCQAIPAATIDHSFKQKMAFVAPWLFEKNKKVGEYYK